MPNTHDTHKTEGGHAFNRITDKCDKCGVTYKAYTDGRQRCQKRPDDKEAMPIDVE
jgi:hypothetical protein